MVREDIGLEYKAFLIRQEGFVVYGEFSTCLYRLENGVLGSISGKDNSFNDTVLVVHIKSYKCQIEV